jgi:hypothetical protein
MDVFRTENPEESFPLLRHRPETLLTRFKGLFYAPLFDVKKLTDYDYKEHPLETVVGKKFQSSTLSKYLVQLERIDAGEALMPALLSEDPGDFSYVVSGRKLVKHLISFIIMSIFQNEDS